MKNNTAPVVFWHSDPVSPNETLVIAGGNFTSDAVVELSVVIEKGEGEPEWTPVKPLQATGTSLKAVIPVAWPTLLWHSVERGTRSRQIILLLT